MTTLVSLFSVSHGSSTRQSPPILHPTTPSTCLVPQQVREVHCSTDSNFPHTLKPGRGSWDDSGKPLHVAEKPPCALTVIPKQLLRWQIIFFQIK